MPPRSRLRLVSSLLLGLVLGLVFVLLLPSGCGSKDPGELIERGDAALGKSDWKGAQQQFEQALAAMETTDPRYKRAKMGQIQALVRTNPDQAKTEFLGLAGGMSSQVDAKDFVAVASQLTSEHKYVDAIAVADAGIKAHVEEPKLKLLMERIKVEAAKAGDAGALDALKGLGYL